MSWEVFFVCALLAAALVAFLVEKIPTDQVSLTVFAVLLVVGALPFSHNLPTPNELLLVFANPAPMTIAAMFILSAALEKTGVIESLASALGRLTQLGYRRFLLVLVLFVAAISAFINNTPVVIVFMPVVLSLARSLKVPASKLLIPLSYASIFGGTCTLVGTSTNILASSILESSGSKPLGMFEIAWVGLPLAFLGTLYLVVFGDRLLPARDSLMALLSPEQRREFLTDAFVQKGSPLAGKSVAESKLLRGRGLRLLELIRNNVSIPVEDPKEVVLQEGDRLVLACRPSGFAHARSVDGLALEVTERVGLETISAHEGVIVEGIIGPNSPIIGQSVRDISFRQRFRVILMAIHRRGVNLRDKLETIPLEAGDLLLMMGSEEAFGQLRRGGEISLLDHPPVPSRSMRLKAPWVVATVVAVVGVTSFNLMPIVAAAMIGAALVISLGCLKTKEGYQTIEWSILMLIYGMLALGLAMQKTGTAALLAKGLTQVSKLPIVTESAGPYVILAALYLTTMVLTETLSNNATVVLMTPIALGLGQSLGVDPRPFVVATCIAASASFSTPVGYQTNTYVYGVGGYRFADFARIGLPLNLLYLTVSLIVIPWIWKF